MRTFCTNQCSDLHGGKKLDPDPEHALDLLIDCPPHAGPSAPAEAPRHNRNLRFYILYTFLLTWFIFNNYGSHSQAVLTDLLWFGGFVLLFVFMVAFVLRDWIRNRPTATIMNYLLNISAIGRFSTVFS